jgi:hypothetical protein
MSEGLAALLLNLMAGDADTITRLIIRCHIPLEDTSTFVPRIGAVVFVLGLQSALSGNAYHRMNG